MVDLAKITLKKAFRYYIYIIRKYSFIDVSGWVCKSLVSWKKLIGHFCLLTKLKCPQTCSCDHAVFFPHRRTMIASVPCLTPWQMSFWFASRWWIQRVSRMWGRSGFLSCKSMHPTSPTFSLALRYSDRFLPSVCIAMPCSVYLIRLFLRICYFWQYKECLEVEVKSLNSPSPSAEIKLSSHHVDM